MNKTVIKNFAVWARNKLIADITYKAGLIGVSEKGIEQPLPQSSKDLQFFDIGTKDYAQVAGADIEQRNTLVRAIQEKESTSDYQTAFHAIIEEVAYTWFNRLIAIRFMEVNDYLPSRIRVLSSENPAKNEPDFVTTPFDTDMEFTAEEQDKIMQLKDENKLDELFRMLFIKQCNKLHGILPELFEETNNYTELLLSISFTDSEGVVYHLVRDIPEDDFNVEKEGQVEIIGWMYQYYNIEPKDETFALLKKNVKITKERIPAATQLFTPDWIVRYMVENSLGRLWVEGHPNDSLKENWKYYLEEAEQEASVQEQLEKIRAEYRKLNPEDIKVIDPCMGSGHILVYCFDVLMQIYESQGYTQRDAAQSILENNLFGLDIDKRAAQLAYFAIMMKARQYDRRIFNREVKPHVYTIEESNGINRNQLKFFGASLSLVEINKAKLQMDALLDIMIDAKEYGSILNVNNYDWDLLTKFAKSIDDAGQMTLDTIGIDQTQKHLQLLITIGRIMAQKYHTVITNPPYMGSSGMSTKLSAFTKKNYPDTKSDLFACFIDKGNRMVKRNCLNCMVTMQSWMSLSSYETMRSNIVNTKTITTLMHMDNMVMGIAFGTAVTVFRNCALPEYKGTYHHIKTKDIVDDMPVTFPVVGNRYVQIATQKFKKIPGSPIAYWVSDQILAAFDTGKILSEYALARNGMKTGDNGRFLRLWWEVCNLRLETELVSYSEAEKSDAKWFPYNKGGEYRKWYGNNDYVVNWEKCGNEIFNHAKSDGRNVQDYPVELKFKPSLSWSLITSGIPAFRYKEHNLSDIAGMSVFADRDRVLRYLALLNSPVTLEILKLITPTINYQAGDIARVPVLDEVNIASGITMLTEQNIELVKQDWDSFETSWDFQKHPLVQFASFTSQQIATDEVKHFSNRGLIRDAYEFWDNKCAGRFAQLKANEEELNRIFIDIYGLQNELTPDVEDKNVTARKADLERDIKSLLSYAVGCMFGRYSLDEDSLAYAGGDWNDNKYSTFLPDKDNCIPITDEPYLEDDIVGLLCVWLKKVYGAETLEENIDFIANALGNKGATSREVIRNYFLNDFMKDHVKIYQKRPIYWLFDSGKQNGFKALVYMHRWNADTVGNLRVEYLHKMQHTYEREIVRMQETIDNSHDSREVSKATKRKDKLQKQLKETKDYDAKLAHIALSRIEINLDDGVKVNYEKVQTGRDGKKVQILAKI